MKPIRAILFDCFHTLIDLRFDAMPEIETESGPVRTTAPMLAGLLSEWGEERAVLDIHKALVSTWLRSEKIRRESFKEVNAVERLGWMLHELNINADKTRIEIFAALHGRSLINGMKPIDGAVDLLRAVSAIMPVGMVSNFDRTETVTDALAEFEMDSYFSTVLVSDAVGIVKPDAQIFLQAAESLKISPHEIMFVGDQPVADVQGALDAGMQPVWYAYREEQRSELPNGVRWVKHLDDLRKAITNA